VRWKILSEFSLQELVQYFEDHKFDNEERAIFTPDFFRFYVRKNPQYFIDVNYYNMDSDTLKFQMNLHAFGELNNDGRRNFCRRIIVYQYHGFSKFILNWINNEWIDPKAYNIVKYAFLDVPFSGKDAIDLFNNKNIFDSSQFSTYINELYRIEKHEGQQLILFKFLISYGIENNLKWERGDTTFVRFSVVEEMLLQLKRNHVISISYRVLLDLELLKRTNNLEYLKDSKKYGKITFESIPYESMNIERILYYIKNDGKGIIRYNQTFNKYIYENIRNFSGLELREVINAIKPIRFTESIEFYKHIKNLDEAGDQKMFEDIDQFIEYCEVKKEEYRKSKDNLYFVFDDALQVFQKYNKRMKKSSARGR